MPNEKLLPEKIKKLRTEKGISQQKLGRYIGISDSAVSKWENGLSEPTLRNLYELSKLFDVPMEFFIDKTEANTKVDLRDDTSGRMSSLIDIYKIGCGPSSSHTIGPQKACTIFKNLNIDADKFRVILYGSLAKTGKGHCTDSVIENAFSPFDCDVEFNYLESNIPHPNTMDIIAYKCNIEISKTRVISIGGGDIEFDNIPSKSSETVYKYANFSDIADYCKKKQIRIWEYALENENNDFFGYMQKVWSTMKNSIKHGLEKSGVLPGCLGVQRKAKLLFQNGHIDETNETKENRLVCSYAFAVSEQNAAGGEIVTAPTCGSAGVIPAVLFYQQQKRGYDDNKIIKALITAGIIGNLIKTNASVSGAECGCQAEIGSACSMAAAALGELFELSIDKIEYAAEIAIEHHLGLTCDPICGLVQIPCIERNAVAAMRAINAVSLANFLWNTRKISFDKVVTTMKETGLDIKTQYKETSEGGLAKLMR